MNLLRRYWVFPLALVCAGLVLFAAAELGGWFSTNPLGWFEEMPLGAAALAGVGLLIVDIALPVPSSLIMVAHGALFGVVPGAFLSFAGSLGCFLFGFFAGRRSSPLLERWILEEDRRRADHFLQRWGWLAIVLSRPVPLLAETVSVVAGSSRLSGGKAIAAAAAGIAPIALIYAFAGSAAAGAGQSSLVFLAVLAVAGLMWLLGRRS